MVTDPAAGASAPATAEIGEVQSFELIPGASGIVMSAVVTGLPEVLLWLAQSAGLAGCTFTPMMSFGVGVGPATEWLPLTPPQIVPLGVPAIPIYFRDRIPGATMIGIQLTAPAGVANSTFRAAIGAGG
jgi:hypothetical protein